MSVSLMSTIWKMDFKNSNSKFVLLALADHDNEMVKNRIFPSVSYIAKKCSLSKSTVFRALNDLEKLGYLERVNRKNEKSENISNLYHITLPFELKLVPSGESQSDTTPSVTVTPPSVSLTLPLVSQCDTNHKSLIIKETNIVEKLFEQVWKAYPSVESNSSKKKTFERFKKIPEVEKLLPDILSAIKRYRLFIEQKRKNGFNQNYQQLTRWLNEENWMVSWTPDPKKISISEFQSPWGSN